MIHPLPHPKPRREPVQATSEYLNRPLRPLAVVVALRDARMAAQPVRAVDLPADCEDGGTAA